MSVCPLAMSLRENKLKEELSPPQLSFSKTQKQESVNIG